MDVKVTKSLLMTALITGSVLWGGTNAFAAESVGEFELDPMVVTAQRMETRDLDTPAAVSVVSKEEMEKIQISIAAQKEAVLVPTKFYVNQ